MAKKKLAIIMAVLFIFTMFPGSAWAAQVSLNLTANSAQVGDSISASGTADANTWVSITVWDGAGNLVVFDAVKSDSSGNYTCTFKVPSLTSGNLLTVVAGYGSNVASKTLTIGSGGGGGEVKTEGVSLNKSSTKITEGASETLVATVVPADASNKAVAWSSNKEAVAQVDENGKVSGVGAGTATITVSTLDGNKKASCDVTVTKPETATNGGSITITPDVPVTITVPQGVTGSITVTQNTALPLVEVNSNKVDMTILPGTQVNGSNTITLPEVMSSSSVNIPAAQQVDLVIKIGSDMGTITFTKPVRLVLKGQGAKSAGFIDNNGNFQVINILASLTGLTSDADADAAGIALSNAGVEQGAVVSGSDLIIWTKHFTEFVAYTPAAAPGGGGGGGGGGSTTTGQTVPSSGGTVNEAGAAVLVPAAAISSDIIVSIKKLGADSIPGIPAKYQLISEVYEITKDKDGNFAKAVTITLPFDLNKVDKEKEVIGIYSWNNSQWELLDNVKVDMAVGKASGDAQHFSKFAVLAEAKPVTAVQSSPVSATLSDISGHWAEANIKQLAAAGAVSGNPDGSFKPDNNITRAEFATILVKAFKLTPQSAVKKFDDTTGHWAQDSISTAASYGIVSGYNETTFGPDDLVTREQMAVMIVKAAGCEAREGRTFADISQISGWAEAAVTIATGNNILNGYPDNTFRPQDYTSRAEAATVILNALKLI